MTFLYIFFSHCMVCTIESGESRDITGMCFSRRNNATIHVHRYKSPKSHVAGRCWKYHCRRWIGTHVSRKDALNRCNTKHPSTSPPTNSTTCTTRHSTLILNDESSETTECKRANYHSLVVGVIKIVWTTVLEWRRLSSQLTINLHLGVPNFRKKNTVLQATQKLSSGCNMS